MLTAVQALCSRQGVHIGHFNAAPWSLHVSARDFSNDSAGRPTPAALPETLKASPGAGMSMRLPQATSLLGHLPCCWADPVSHWSGLLLLPKCAERDLHLASKVQATAQMSCMRSCHLCL